MFDLICDVITCSVLNCDMVKINASGVRQIRPPRIDVCYATNHLPAINSHLSGFASRRDQRTQQASEC